VLAGRGELTTLGSGWVTWVGSGLVTWVDKKRGLGMLWNFSEEEGSDYKIF